MRTFLDMTVYMNNMTLDYIYRIIRRHFTAVSLKYRHYTLPLQGGVGGGILLFLASTLVVSCARMGHPDGGWYDETPPRVIATHPKDKGTDVKSKRVNIYFNEFIKIDNATENVIVSPPQLEAAEIKGMGKHIQVTLRDSLKANTTYTVDFSDAITDNNEGNPLGNYTYSFSTGPQIDTMEVAGNVVEAADLEPVKGILVGLYSNLTDSAFTKQPMLRVARTDSRGRFVIKGVAPGRYRIYALQDADGDYTFKQKSEKIAFNRDIIIPSVKPDTRQDTIWRDSLRIDSISLVHYTHYLPDDVVLRAFNELITDRYLLKTERTEANHFTLFFSYGNPQLPRVRGLNFNADNAFITESNARRDTVNYWLRDSSLINQDTLRVQLQYEKTDSNGVLQLQTDTLDILSKQTYEWRRKQQQKAIEEWTKKQEKAKKKGEPYETQMPMKPLAVKIEASSELDPDKNIFISLPAPSAVVDTGKIHLYSKHDTLWYRSPFLLHLPRSRDKDSTATTDTTLIQRLKYELIGEWRPNIEYSLEIDSAAFIDIYGRASTPFKKGFKVHSTDDYSSLLVKIPDFTGQHIIAQLLNGDDKVIKEVATGTGTVEFFYIKPGSYYLRMFVDGNDNGIWDTGNFAQDRQPEAVYYYPEAIECKAKWDVTQTWNPTARSVAHQKPDKLIKQKADKQKTIRHRNAERARQLGIEMLKQ